MGFEPQVTGLITNRGWYWNVTRQLWDAEDIEVVPLISWLHFTLGKPHMVGRKITMFHRNHQNSIEFSLLRWITRGSEVTPCNVIHSFWMFLGCVRSRCLKPQRWWNSPLFVGSMESRSFNPHIASWIQSLRWLRGDGLLHTFGAIVMWMNFDKYQQSWYEPTVFFRVNWSRFVTHSVDQPDMIWWDFKHFLFSISYMGCHPSHWRTHIFQDG